MTQNEAFVHKPNHLYVVTCVFNPTNANIRTKLYLDFVDYLSDFKNVTLITVELAFGDKPFNVTHNENPHHTQLRTNDVLWYKENLLNIAFKRLPADAEYVAWIDADVEFENTNWVNATLEALQSYKLVQLFDRVVSLGPRKEILRTDPGLIHSWMTMPICNVTTGQPGGAWAARTETLCEMNYLIDWDIVGSSDRHAALTFIGKLPLNQITCIKKNMEWARKVTEVINQSVSCIPGTLVHFFHGYPKDRGYSKRGTILVDNNFDPYVDIAYDQDGLLYLSTNKPQLRTDLCAYFNSRKDHGGERILHVITCVFNPSNYQSRYHRYFEFAHYLKQFPNVRLHTIELAIGNQPFQVTQKNNPNHHQLHSNQALWYKENLLNILIQRLPPEAEDIVWSDCDIQWENPNWVTDTFAALDQHPVVQMFEEWQNLDENNLPLGSPIQSFAKRWVDGTQTEENAGSTGLAWAAKRSVLQKLGGLIDWGIVGSGDYYMAYALTGRNHSDAIRNLSRDPSLGGIVETYRRTLDVWIARADQHVNRNLGVVKGRVRHFHHGKHHHRGYPWRWTILAKHNYDPQRDISYRLDGLLCVSSDKSAMLQDILDYFHQRREDDALPIVKETAQDKANIQCSY